ncbi:hypothetical protein [Methylobacterium komagatae]|uniref:hypothetical protein n=1 Tax=Methylobacterium komagatae TaxID=374425 RepID=UPI00366E616C
MLAASGGAETVEARSASSIERYFARSMPENTGAVTLGMLSVKPLGVDRPWDPRVCIGCDRNNGSSPRRVQRPHYR